jgi:hypothetical protein
MCDIEQSFGECKDRLVLRKGREDPEVYVCKLPKYHKGPHQECFTNKGIHVTTQWKNDGTKKLS